MGKFRATALSLFGAYPPGRVYRTTGVFLGRAFIGQTPQAPASEENRLLGLKTSSILDRIMIDPAWAKYIRLLEEVKSQGKGGGQAAVPDLPKDDAAVLKEIRKSPTPAELEDLSVIDSFFLHDPHQLGVWRYMSPGVDRRFYGPKQVLPCEPPAGKIPANPGLGPVFNRTLREANDLAKTLPDLTRDPFFCTRLIPIAENMVTDTWYGHGYFGIKQSDTWGENRVLVWNAISMLEALKDYPFPSPIPAMPVGWYDQAADDVRKFVHSGLIINPALARFWITLETVLKYNSVAAGIMSKLKAKAKREKRAAIIEAVIIAVVGTVITLGLAAVIAPALVAAGASTVVASAAASATASATVQAAQYEYGAEEKKQAAKDLERVAKQFEASDKGFSTELDKAATVLDYEAAQEAKAAGLTEEERAAIEESRRAGPDVPPGPPANISPEEFRSGGGPSTELLVGGGIAAAGVTALALFS